VNSTAPELGARVAGYCRASQGERLPLLTWQVRCTARLDTGDGTEREQYISAMVGDIPPGLVRSTGCMMHRTALPCFQDYVTEQRKYRRDRDFETRVAKIRAFDETPCSSHVASHLGLCQHLAGLPRQHPPVELRVDQVLSSVVLSALHKHDGSLVPLGRRRSLRLYANASERTTVNQLRETVE